MAQTRAVLQLIANKYAQPQYQDVVVAIELLNEPLSFKVNGGPEVVGQYYKDTYGDVRVISDTPVVMHDGFQHGSFWNDVLPYPDATGVVLDHHEYQVFMTDLLDLSPAVCAYWIPFPNNKRSLTPQTGTCPGNLHQRRLLRRQHQPLGRRRRMDRGNDRLRPLSQRVWNRISVGRDHGRISCQYAKMRRD